MLSKELLRYMGQKLTILRYSRCMLFKDSCYATVPLAEELLQKNIHLWYRACVQLFKEKMTK